MTDTSNAVDALVADLVKDRPEDAPGALPAVWASLDELGLGTVGVPEASGGSGGALSDLIDLATSLGRYAVSSPLLEHATARWVLASHDDAVQGIVTLVVRDTDLDPADASGELVLHEVPWARHADHLLVSTPTALVLVDLAHDGVTIHERVNEAGEARDTVRVTEVAPRTPLQPTSPQAIANRLGLLWAAALAGAIEATYQLTRDYVNTRTQFGAPLVKIPAVAALLATLKAELVQVDAALVRARWLADDSLDSDTSTAATATARVMAARAATVAARLGHQLHGGMGITAEYPLHLHTTRLWAWRDEAGSERQWAAHLGELARAHGEQGLWNALTSQAGLTAAY